MAGASNPAMAGQPNMARAAAPAAMPAVGNNVFQQAAGAQQQAQQTLGGLANMRYSPMQAAQMGPAATMQAVGQVGNVSAPGQIAVNQLATTDLSAYMNPYTQEVINRTAQDIGSAQQQAMNQLGAQAAAARAFGGSRQAIAESLANQQFIDQLARTSADLRARGFETALQAGQFDIGQMQAARSLASQQQMQANQLNQQAAEMAAAREQAVRAGNVAAANQFATQQAQLQQAANQANFGGQFTTAGVRAGAAGQLAGLGQQMFGQGQDITRQQQEFGLRQQAINQALIDAARNQFGGFAGAPQRAISLPLAAVGGANMGQQTQTQRYSPGLFDYLSLGAGIGGGIF